MIIAKTVPINTIKNSLIIKEEVTAGENKICVPITALTDIVPCQLKK